MNPGGCTLSLTYIASELVVPGYGGGMSSAKAQLESDTKVLAYEAGLHRWTARDERGLDLLEQHEHLRDARRALDNVRLLAEQDDERGYEQLRVALRQQPINGVRKAASKVLKELTDGSDYKARRSAQYAPTDFQRLVLGCIDEFFIKSIGF